MSEIEVEVQTGEGVAPPVGLDRIAAAVEHTLRAEGLTAAELSVTLLTDAEIARMNQEFLDHAGPTDVISFPLHAPGQPVVGDVYVGVDQARRQAADLEVPLQEELLRLAVHGTLHVLGYDHPDGDEREHSPMYLRQEELLRTLLGR
jgi:probable rRNA maturation factor